jgi:choline dehydrogenase-like flavoprotein
MKELGPYLERSARYLGLEVESGFTDDCFWLHPGHRRPKLDTDPEKLLPMFWQYSRDPIHRDAGVRFGRGLSADLPTNVVLVTNATVLRINVTKCASRVETLDFSSIDGHQFSLQASTVVVCAGGIESARLLLSSDNVMPQGLGNQKDLVGRFLMDHLRTTVAKFETVNNKAVINRFGMYRSRAVGGNLYQNGMRLSPTIQRSEQLLNCAIWVGEHIGQGDPWNSLEHLLRGQDNSREDLATVLKNSPLMARGLTARFITHRGIPRKLDALTLVAMCEQRPNPESRLTLSDRRDRLGMRITRIDWRVSEEEGRVLRRIAELAVEQFLRLGLEPPVLEEWVVNGAMFPETTLDRAHPTGTTRMADDPARGVVNAKCQVHGIDGLFVAGSSVFPTAGQANPTQMIIALALRLADTLKNRITTVAAVRRSVPDLAIHNNTEL